MRLPSEAHPVLDNWSLIYRDPIDPYTAPELVRPCLSGTVTGDTRFKDGEVITTGTLVWRRGDHIATKRTVYCLGTIDPAYEAAYPNARARLFAAFPEAKESADDLSPVTLHVYHIEDQADHWYVATDADDALAQYVADCGYPTMKAYLDENHNALVSEVPDEMELTLHYPDISASPGSGEVSSESQLASEWVKEGRGWLAGNGTDL